MLKYLWTRIIFQEVPSEVSLGISISGCQIHCKGCNQRELWEDNGEILDVETLCGLINQNQGITAVCLFGGEHDIDALTELFMYAHKRVNTAWYCGLDRIPKDKLGILDYLDYVKIGSFDLELGPINEPTTNQRFYQFSSYFSDCTILGAGWKDITYKFWKSNLPNQTT